MENVVLSIFSEERKEAIKSNFDKYAELTYEAATFQK